MPIHSGDELAAFDWTAHSERARFADAPQRQAQAHQDGDAGVDIQGGPHDPACRALGSWLGGE